MTPKDIPALVQRLEAANIELFECSWPDGALRLCFEAAETKVETPLAERATQLASPGIGILRLCHPLAGGNPLAQGAQVETGQLVAYLETGDILLPIYASQSGVIARWLVDDGTLTGYGAPLIEFR